MSPLEQPGLRAFRCNVCGAANEKPASAFGREIPSCDACGSTVRARALVRMLACEIFGADMALPDLPVLKSLRGIGMSDSELFASRLAQKFDYRNTYLDREPRLDVLNPAPGDIAAYDFIVSSEVLEHVAAPVERAFENLFRMLKPNGLLLMTVPYRPAGDLQERFGPMSSFGLVEIDGRTVLVGRSAQGGYEVHDNLVFHGGSGATLEMRVFSDASIRRCLAAAGFEIRVYTEDAPGFGVVYDETWSLPIAARKGQFAFAAETRREWTEQWVRAGAEWAQAHDLARQLEFERAIAANLRQKLNERNDDAQALVLDFDRRMRAATTRHDEVTGQLTATVREREKWIEAFQAEVAHHKQLFEGAEAARQQEVAQANAALERAEAELGARTGWARALQVEVAAARERTVALETMLRPNLFARVKRRLGLGQR